MRDACSPAWLDSANSWTHSPKYTTSLAPTCATRSRAIPTPTANSSGRETRSIRWRKAPCPKLLQKPSKPPLGTDRALCSSVAASGAAPSVFEQFPPSRFNHPPKLAFRLFGQHLFELIPELQSVLRVALEPAEEAVQSLLPISGREPPRREQTLPGSLHVRQTDCDRHQAHADRKVPRAEAVHIDLGEIGLAAARGHTLHVAFGQPDYPGREVAHFDHQALVGAAHAHDQFAFLAVAELL